MQQKRIGSAHPAKVSSEGPLAYVLPSTTIRHTMDAESEQSPASSTRSSGSLIRPYSGLFTVAQRLLDVFAIVLARLIACWVYPESWHTGHTVIALCGILAFTVTSDGNNVYRSWRAVPLPEQLRAVLWSWALTAPLLLLWLFVSKTTADHSRFINVVWFALAPAFMCAWRAAERAVLARARMNGANSRTAGIIGATRMGLRLTEQLKDPTHGIRLRGTYDARTSDRVAKYLGDSNLVGDIDQAVQDARNGLLDFVYITLPLRAESRISETIAQLADTTATVQVVTDFSVFDLLHSRWSSVGDIPTVSVFDTPFSGVAGWTKRVEDLVLGTLLLLLFTPVMLGIALVIKCTSRGPVLFRQTRYGLNGRPIRVCKFRTMTVLEDGGTVTQAKRGDSRITKVGAFLRATSLDELPQFWNVVCGEMSIVGPRPHAVAHNETYRSLIHGYMLRHKVKPGITGWAQVNGCRGETDTVSKMRERVKFDLEYIDNWKLSWDLKIIVQTAMTVVRDKNAY